MSKNTILALSHLARWWMKKQRSWILGEETWSQEGWCQGKVKKRNLKAKAPQKGKPHHNQNPILVSGIGSFSPSAMCSSKAMAKRKSSAATFKVEKKETYLAADTKPLGGVTEMVGPEWISFTECLDTVLLKRCLESCWATKENLSVRCKEAAS